MWKLSPKILFLSLSFIILTNQSIVRSAKLKCDFTSSSGVWKGIEGSIYYCRIVDNDIFTGTRVMIDSVEGTHKAKHTNHDVKAIISTSISSINFFPQNFQNIFGDLLVIIMSSANLQEIHQNDLKYFTVLMQLDLEGNNISIIDEDLFKFNPELRAINLRSNRIYHIDPNVFDHLDNLVWLWLNENGCKKALRFGQDSREQVLQLIQRVRNAECSSTDILQKKKEEQELAIKNVTQSQIEIIEKNFKSVIQEKSREINELQEKLRNAEKINEESVKNCEEFMSELENNLGEQSRNDLNEIENKNQELRAKNENLTVEMSKCINIQKCEQLNSNKMMEMHNKYEELLHSKLTVSEELNEKLHECKDKSAIMLQGKQDELNELNQKHVIFYEAKYEELIECKDKYASLLHGKFIASEKINKELNEEIRKINSGD